MTHLPVDPNVISPDTILISIHAIQRRSNYTGFQPLNQVSIPAQKRVIYLEAKIRNVIEYQVSGRYALFSNPALRMGGEKATLPVPTYQALKGITEQVYWKPSLIWLIDSVRILHPIQTESKSIRPTSYDGQPNTLSVYTYLKSPLYQVRAHFIPNPYRTEPDLIADGQNENKHHCIARRMVERGGRRDIYLGTRECQAYVEPCTYGDDEGYYDARGEVDLGVMFHSFAYPDETGRDELGIRLWRAKMVNGEIHFPRPEDCDPALYRFVRPMKPKKFGGRYGNFSSASEEGDGW